jgi:hypothetical protein
MRITYGLARDGAPVWLQKFGVRALAPVGRLAGYDNEYPEYLPP